MAASPVVGPVPPTLKAAVPVAEPPVDVDAEEPPQATSESDMSAAKPLFITELNFINLSLAFLFC